MSSSKFDGWDAARLAAERTSIQRILSDAKLVSSLPDKGSRLRSDLTHLLAAEKACRAAPPSPPLVRAASSPSPARALESPPGDECVLPETSGGRAATRIVHDPLAFPVQASSAAQGRKMSSQRSKSLGVSSSSSSTKAVGLNDVRRLLHELQATNDALLAGLKPRKPSPALGVTLFPHQQHGLNWMIARERGQLGGSARGGIIADEMGLGKTLQMIALIVTHRKVAEDSKDRKPTLVVCPRAVLDQWAKEFTKHVHDETMTVYKYYGASRKRATKLLQSHTLVLTTYATVLSDYKALGDDTTSKTKDGLFSMRWRRLVLDEGHVIRNAAAKTAKAVIALDAKRRWSMTGTPLQNSLDDLYSTFLFLRVEPFYSDRKAWKKTVSKAGKRGVKRLHTLLSPLLLRRTKSDSQPADDNTPDPTPIVDLPERHHKVHRVPLTGDFRSFYRALKRRADGLTSTSSNTAVMLTMLLRLRQACCHPRLCFSLDEDDELAPLDDDAPKSEQIVHRVATKLIKHLRRKHDEPQPSSVDDLASQLENMNLHAPAAAPDDDVGELADIMGGLSLKPSEPTAGDLLCEHPSAKLRELSSILEHIESTEPGAKSVVFSQWTGMLDLVAEQLDKDDIAYERFDGSMSTVAQQDAISSFKENSTRVLLISLKAGGVGLNLTCANHVIMMDVWWNPAIEQQAFDRVYRVGQKKETYIHQIIVEDSVEEGILKLQKRKQRLADGALGGDQAQESAELSFAELRALFDN